MSLLNFNLLMAYMIHEMLVLLNNSLNHFKNSIFNLGSIIDF